MTPVFIDHFLQDRDKKFALILGAYKPDYIKNTAIVNQLKQKLNDI